ncbi:MULTISPECIES: hypothetical protein [unclassified Polaromonas]|uniref:hypothetical protein n=1 Tax=unclassified Polaromonas TaxID=2638319 RepID=UPI000BCFEF95|nr:MULTISPECIES: hypothetical protein [unclassified Polaromonas]OYY34745.1 MAG: hypothetical protein B7Y60_14990 [Polaromonas sp. 35-63-35]OYZ19370.1 MAG: hypothetical protein B7Y28_12600 [Polaromonas sp. 16-63-31]OYZ77505.1 MAG: hypothetical protein B7Y09_16140 [Polaromonas sp. 24-63-21]OZA48511.1 MAG: hypothetical protein B7X88_18370 [Polaromonas sp. 17-63-33]OZA87261.1 MAG: hypothetical protein B7X65_13850 [Polaromonas sp. 39-63-25]
MNTQAEPSVRAGLEEVLRACDTGAKLSVTSLAAIIRLVLAEHDATTQSQRAEIERLRAALEDVAECTDPDKDDNYRSDDREGCLDAVFATASAALTPQPTKETP